jgi:uncharacterized membrane protein YdjX (TVP38/TMEM64 family)
MRLLLWFAGSSLLVLLIWMIWGGHWAHWSDVAAASEQLRRYGEAAGLVGMLLLVLDLLLPVPGTVVMSALGYLYGTLAGAGYALAGSTMAGLCGYGIGRLLPERLSRRFLGEKDFARGRSLFAEGGGWIIALSRALPILPESLAVSAGLLRMPLRKFFFALLCGNIPMSLIFSWIGATGHNNPSQTILMSFLLPALLWSSASYWHKKWNS